MSFNSSDKKIIMSIILERHCLRLMECPVNKSTEGKSKLHIKAV